ncbi:MAG: hypothetical protein PHY79_10735 [Anaerolineae bacterium]|nr:hypothetical protein [Anaerolineae bacterium]
MGNVKLSSLARSGLVLFVLLTVVVSVSPLPGQAAPESPSAPVAAVQSRWSCSPPGIDGLAPVEEWGTAPFLSLPHAQVYFLNDDNYLYVLIDVVGDDADDPLAPAPVYGDYFWLAFDVDLDGLIDPDLDVLYSLYPTLPYVLGLSYYLGPGTWTGINPTVGSLGTRWGPSLGSPAPHRVWEMSIPLSEIDTTQGALVRLGVRAHSVDPAFLDEMPAGFAADFQDLVELQLVDTKCAGDLLAKSVFPDSANPGDVVNYRLDYILPGPDNYVDVTIRDALPPGLTYLPGSANPPATFSGRVLTWKLGDLPAGTLGSVHFQALVDHDACRRGAVIENTASLGAAAPPIHAQSLISGLQLICRPIEFPTDNPPYAESEITVDPYPIVTGQPTRLCTEITNASPQTQTVQVEFALANFGIGLPFAPIDAPGNPRLVEVPPGATVQVCIQWIPVTPGHQCIQVTVYDEAGTFPALRSQRNLDVSEVLVPGQPATFELPVGNQTGGPVDVQMVVRNNCPGWTVDVQPPTFFLPIGGTEVVGVVVTPAAGSALGSGCTVDVEAWAVGPGGNLLQLLGGVRKVDEPLIPLGDPGERPFAEKEIWVNPYPLVSGEPAEVCVLLENNTDADQEVTLEFMLSGLGIGLAFDRINPISGANPQTMVIPAHTSVVACLKFLPGAPGHHCLAVKLSMPNGYVTYSRRNLDVAELLEPNVPEEVPIAVANPTPDMADIDLVVDNTCPGWSAWVSPALLVGVGPNSTDVRTAILTVTPPAGLLGAGCHIDLLAYINGKLIGGVRKIDRPPLAPPIDQPHWAETEITVSPDPPQPGQPAMVCVKLMNPTPVDQVVDVTFAAADFGAGVPFADFGGVKDSVIPAEGTLTICMPWTPAAAGTLHRCLRVQIHQDGYHDVFSQRNVDLFTFSLHIFRLPAGKVDLPPFVLHNPMPHPVPSFFDVVLVGLSGVGVEVVNAETGNPLPPGEEVLLGPGELKPFFLRLRRESGALLAAQPEPEPRMVGDQHYIDVLPYSAGQPLRVDGVHSGVRYLLETPKAYLPLVMRQF